MPQIGDMCTSVCLSEKEREREMYWVASGHSIPVAEGEHPKKITFEVFQVQLRPAVDRFPEKAIFVIFAKTEKWQEIVTVMAETNIRPLQLRRTTKC